jgi:hypothetical protein
MSTLPPTPHLPPPGDPLAELFAAAERTTGVPITRHLPLALQLRDEVLVGTPVGDYLVRLSVLNAPVLLTRLATTAVGSRDREILNSLHDKYSQRIDGTLRILISGGTAPLAVNSELFNDYNAARVILGRYLHADELLALDQLAAPSIVVVGSDRATLLANLRDEALLSYLRTMIEGVASVAQPSADGAG